MKIKRIFLPILMVLFLVGCSTTKTMTMELHVDTGDTVTITVDASDGHTISFDKDNSIINLSNGNEVIARGVFVPQSSYALYYETAYTDDRCTIYESGEGTGISYVLYSYTEDNIQNCEYIGWVTGTNTGVVFESETLDMEEGRDLFVNKLSFDFKETSQVNKSYSYKPNIDKNNISPTTIPEMSSSNKEDNQTEKYPNEQNIKETPVPTVEPQQQADWTSLAVKIDGAYYTFPFSYKNLKANGWDFDFNEYLDEGETEYPLEMGEYTYSTTKLNNDKYGYEPESAAIYVGFKNYSEDTKNILDCDLWAIEICGVYGTTQSPTYPDVELPGGIKFGATEEEIVSVYGEPNERKDMDYYIQMDYDNNYSEHMTLYVYTGTGKKGEAKGLFDIELRGYN